MGRHLRDRLYQRGTSWILAVFAAGLSLAFAVGGTTLESRPPAAVVPAAQQATEQPAAPPAAQAPRPPERSILGANGPDQDALALAQGNPPPILGVNSHFYFHPSDQDVGKAMDLYRKAGGRYLRECVTWSSVERSRGRYDWRAADRLVRLAEEHGLELVVVVTRSPQWARSPRTSPTSPPSDLESFERFTRAAAERYRGRIRHWQIWNEVDSAAFWAPRLPFEERVDRYAQLLAAGSRGIRQGAPEARVLLSGLAMQTHLPIFEKTRKRRPPGAGLRKVVGHREIPPGEDALHFFQTLVARPDVQENFDVVAAHMLRPDHRRWLPPLRSLMARTRVEAPLWITETGVPSGASDGTSAEAQAAFLRNTWTWSRAVGAEAVFVFELVDRPAESDNPEAHFGLLTRQLEPKPAFGVLQDLLREGRTEERASQADRGLQG